MTHSVRSGAWALTLALALSLSTTSITRADAGPGAVRLGADVGVLGLTHFPDTLNDTSFQFGLWNNTLYRPVVDASFGFQIIEPLIIGARAGFGATVMHINRPPPFDGGDTHTTGLFSLVPFVEYMFLEGSIRPFIGGEVGFQLQFPDGGDTQAGFVAGALGGVHIFLEESFSISPTLIMDFLYRGGDERAGLAFAGVVSVHGWIN